MVVVCGGCPKKVVRKMVGRKKEAEEEKPAAVAVVDVTRGSSFN